MATTLNYIYRDLYTRLEKECEFLWKLAITERNKDFVKTISEATDEQLAAIIEILYYCDLLISPRLPFGLIASKILPSRITRSTDCRNNIIQNWHIVRGGLAVAIHDMYITEALKKAISQVFYDVYSL